MVSLLSGTALALLHTRNRQIRRSPFGPYLSESWRFSGGPCPRQSGRVGKPVSVISEIKCPSGRGMIRPLHRIVHRLIVFVPGVASLTPAFRRIKRTVFLLHVDFVHAPGRISLHNRETMSAPPREYHVFPAHRTWATLSAKCPLPDGRGSE